MYHSLLQICLSLCLVFGSLLRAFLRCFAHTGPGLVNRAERRWGGKTLDFLGEGSDPSTQDSLSASSLTAQPSVRVREGEARPRCGRQEDLGDPGQKLPRDAVCGEKRRAEGAGLQAERGAGERRRQRN